MASNTDLDGFIGVLCNKGAKWKMNKGLLMFFKASVMKNDPNLWYHFLVARLLLVKHLSDMIRNKAILLYAIIFGMSINVG